jgi:hypothetical protein
VSKFEISEKGEESEESEQSEPDDSEPYHMEPLWVGFFGHHDIDLSNTSIVVEITKYSNSIILII